LYTSPPMDQIKMETPGHDLEQVRSELRRLGYLNHGVERFLLQDALRPQRPGRTLLHLTVKVGLLSGVALALALALALVTANAEAAAGPLMIFLDTLALFLHLFPPISLVTAGAFLALGGVLLAILRIYPVRRIETLSLAAAVGAGAAGLAFALRGARSLLAENELPVAVLLGLATSTAIYLLIKLVYHGLLTLAIQLTDSAPEARLFSRRWLGLSILSAAFLLTVPALLSARREPPPPPSTLPIGPGERVVLLGVDGVLPEEVDYLMRIGDLPAFSALAQKAPHPPAPSPIPSPRPGEGEKNGLIPGAAGAPLSRGPGGDGRGDGGEGPGGGEALRYVRRDEPPASFWTSVATGLRGPAHGVAALDSFRPLGMRTPLARSGLLRAWWSGVEVPLGLAEHKPLLANRRSAFTVWELAARGGSPVVAVNWWATFPAEPLPGLVVAHGAWQLLRDGAEGAAAPAAEVPALRALAAGTGLEIPTEPLLETRLAAALPPAAAAAVLDRALIPDRFYRQVFTERLAGGPRAAALYLPGLDIAAAGWRGGDVAFADLVRSELRAADRVLAQAMAAADLGTVAVVLDPGRRRVGGEGRLLLWRRAGCTGSGPAVTPETVASALLRALGLPQSAELPPPPAGCRWAPPPVSIAGYGTRGRKPVSAAEGSEYLQSLRSLGYL
jgi:hypothetical protein